VLGVLLSLTLLTDTLFFSFELCTFGSRITPSCTPSSPSDFVQALTYANDVLNASA